MKDDPITLRTLSKARDAWMYRNPRSLDVVVEVEDIDGRYLGTATVRIMRKQIEEWIERSNKP